MSLESGYTARLTAYAQSGTIELDFEKWSGGNLKAPDTKHRNPVTRRETARGGLPSRDNVTLTRECDASCWAVKSQLESCAGIDRGTGVRQMVGPRGDVIGSPLTVTGLILEVNYPDYDLSGDGVGMLEVVLQADEVLG